MAAPPSSSSYFWSHNQSRPASRGENIQNEQFIVKKPGKLQPHVHLHKTPNSYRLKHRTESAVGSGKGHGNLDGSYTQSLLQFRPNSTSTHGQGQVTKFESNGDELRSKQFKSTSSSRPNRQCQPDAPPSDTAARLPPRPGTVGGYPSKPNVYRNYSSQSTCNSNKFVPILPLTAKKWTASPDPHEQNQRSTQRRATLIPLPTRNPFGYITNKIRDRVIQAQQITFEEQSTHVHTEFPPGKQDTHFSPLSSNYPPIVPYLYPTSLPTFTDGDLHPSLSILRTCDQFSPIPIDLVFKDIKKLRKVGEGVYGEVYLGVFGFADTTESVYKIVAVEGKVYMTVDKLRSFSVSHRVRY